MAKVIQAAFGSGCMTKTKAVFQWDNGDKLKFLNADLPDTYSVHFANSLSGQATTVIGDESGVEIPPQYFVPGSEIYAWVYISDSNGGYTKYQATIPVWKRAQPSDHTPTPAQQDVIDQAITLLNEATSVIMSSQFKESLLQLARKVAYIDGNGQTYYDDLYNALYPTPTWNVTNTLTRCTTSNPAEVVPQDGPYSATITANPGYTLYGATVVITMGGNDVTNTAYSNGSINIPNVTGDLVITVVAAAKVLSSISAFYTQSGTVYDTDSLTILKSDLVVTANYADSSTQTVPAADYTLSGTLTAGTSTITVSYGGKTDTFDVTVTEKTPVYMLTNRTFNNDGSVDSGIAYLTTDKDFTIMCDADFAGQQSGQSWCLFKMMNAADPYPGVAISAVDANANYIMAVWMTAKNASGATSNIPMVYSYVGNVKVVLTHSAGSGAMTYYVKVGENAVVTATLTSSFTSITTNLAIGGNLSNSQKFNGTVNLFALYDEVKTGDEINAFLS